MASPLLQDAWQFLSESVELVTIPPYVYVTVIAAVSFVWAAVKQRPFRNRLWKPHHWLFLTHCLFSVAAFYIGSRWPGDPTRSHVPNDTGVFWLYVVQYGSLASCVFWVWKMKGFRWLAAGLMALLELVTLGAIFLASLAVSADSL